MKKRKRPHSIEFFGPERDFWWNQDFLALTAKRLRLRGARRILDVGCGVGHWGRALLPHLPAHAQLWGVDPEPRWVARARQLAARGGLASRTHYSRGAVESLPFPDEEFDLVTCQTVLIHVADPRRALAEMLRVVRPGGRLLFVEPNNLASALVFGSTLFDAPIEERLELVRLQSVCERGKELLGEGNDSLGDVLPGLLAEAGGVDIDVYLSDRATPLVPPYGDPAQETARDQLLDWADRDLWLWPRAEARRYFFAGGGDAATFTRLWSIAMRSLRSIARDLRAGSYHTAGGGILYLIYGRRAGRRVGSRAPRARSGGSLRVRRAP